MSAVFTQHAIERMRRHDVTAIDVSHLLEKVERMASSPGTLTSAQDVVRVGRERGEETFIIRAGEMRAVMAIDAAHPERIIVLSVYRADEEGPASGGTTRDPVAAG